MSDSEEYDFSGNEEVVEEIDEQSDNEESLRNGESMVFSLFKKITFVFSDLAQTPFEELLAMRDKLGTKVYRESVLKKLSTTGPSETSSNEDKTAKYRLTKPKAKPITVPKKKSQPVVANSKRLETRHNFTILPVPSIATKANAFRDPRFEPSSGIAFQLDKFEDNYRFLTSMKKEELDRLQKLLKRTKSPEEKAKLTRSMGILRSQIRAETQKEKAREVERGVKAVVAKDLAPPAPRPPSNSEAPQKDPKLKVFVNKSKTLI